MKKFKKNLSRTIFASFFILQFVVSTSFMPLVANAEEVSVDSEKVSEEKQPEIVMEEKVDENVSEEIVSEETKIEESEVSDSSDISKEVSDLGDAENAPSESTDKNSTDESSVDGKVAGQFVDANLTVCKVVLDSEGNVVTDVAGTYPDAVFTVPVSGPGYSSDVIFNSNDFNSYTNTTFGFDENAFDAKCQTIVVPLQVPDISFLSEYSYGEEVTGGNYLWDVKYNDSDFNTLSAWSYGESDIPNSDGEFLFTGNMTTGFETTVLVVNRFVQGGVCDAFRVYARVNLQKLENSAVQKENNGWYNTGNGNMAPKVFVGGTTDLPNEDGGDVYDIGEWFLVYDPVTGYVNDPALTSTDPGVNGLAVQRLDGQVRLVLYGSHSQPQGNLVFNREMANGFIDFSNDQSNVSSDVVIVNQVVDLVNPLESNPNAPIDYPNNDYISFTPVKSNFKFVVTTHNDGMYTIFNHTLAPEDCGGGGPTNNAPTLDVDQTPVCLLESVQEYDFLNGVTANDIEDGNLTGSIVITGNTVRLGFVGSYTVTYSVEDSGGLVAGGTRIINVAKNCAGGGGDNTAPKLIINPSVRCIQTDASSYNFFGGVTATDAEQGDLTSTITYTVNPDPIIFGVDGVYEITYTVIDREGLSATGTRTLYIKENCGGDGEENTAPKIVVNVSQTCYLTSLTKPEFDFLEGVVASDVEDGVLIPTYTHDIIFGTPGFYTINYSVTDSDGATATASRSIYIKENCGGDGGGDKEFTVIVDKIVCDSETDLPNFGAGGPNITANTAADFVASHPNCELVKDWVFEWAPYNTVNPGDNQIGLSGGVWNSFTSSVNIPMPNGTDNDTKIWVREVMSDGYIPFTGVNTTQDVSAEMYCHTDVLNYDNYDRVDNISEGGVYNCVAWNVQKDTTGGGGNHAPVITGENACIETSAGSLTEEQIKALVNVTDADGDTVTLTYVVNPDPIDFGTMVGEYSITYTANDNHGHSIEKMITINIKDDCNPGNGGGGEDEPMIMVPGPSCYKDGDIDETFNLFDGVSAKDSLDGDVLAADLEANTVVTITFNGDVVTDVDFSEIGEYVISYTFTDVFLKEVTATRTIEVKSRCSGGGGGGGSSSSGSSGHGSSSNGEVLGTTSCVAFTTYNRLGNSGGEIKALQTFLNEYMNAGLTVDGVYGRSTVQAVHDFQAFHWSEVIDPWTPPLSPNTTGWEYKTTRMTINAIINCPEAPVYLEDPGIMYQVLQVQDTKPLTTEQIQKVYDLLVDAQSGSFSNTSTSGEEVLGAFTVNYDYGTISYDPAFAGK